MKAQQGGAAAHRIGARRGRRGRWFRLLSSRLRHGLEGIVSKRIGSRYVSGRTGHGSRRRTQILSDDDLRGVPNAELDRLLAETMLSKFGLTLTTIGAGTGQEYERRYWRSADEVPISSASPR